MKGVGGALGGVSRARGQGLDSRDEIRGLGCLEPSSSPPHLSLGALTSLGAMEMHRVGAETGTGKVEQAAPELSGVETMWTNGSGAKHHSTQTWDKSFLLWALSFFVCKIQG